MAQPYAAVRRAADNGRPVAGQRVPVPLADAVGDDYHRPRRAAPVVHVHAQDITRVKLVPVGAPAAVVRAVYPYSVGAAVVRKRTDPAGHLDHAVMPGDGGGLYHDIVVAVAAEAVAEVSAALKPVPAHGIFSVEHKQLEIVKVVLLCMICISCIPSGGTVLRKVYGYFLITAEQAQPVPCSQRSKAVDLTAVYVCAVPALVLRIPHAVVKAQHTVHPADILPRDNYGVARFTAYRDLRVFRLRRRTPADLRASVYRAYD